MQLAARCRDAQLPGEWRVSRSQLRANLEKFLSSQFYPLCTGQLCGLGEAGTARQPRLGQEYPSATNNQTHPIDRFFFRLLNCHLLSASGGSVL